MKKTVKEKPIYTTRQNIKFVLSNMWKWDKPLVYISVAQAPLKVLLQLSVLYIVRLVISLIENNSDILYFVFQVTLFSIFILLLNILNNIINAQINTRQISIRDKYIKLLYYKSMDTDYENIENPDGMNKMQKGFQALMGRSWNINGIINALVFALTSVLSILSLFAIITTLSPILLITITALTIVQHYINKAGHNWRYINAEKWAPIDRKLNHINFISGDFERAKDIRLYGLKTWLKDIFADVLGKRISWYNKLEKALFCYHDLNQAIIQLILCNGITYIYLITSVSNGAITIADAVFYLTAIGTLSGVIMDVFNSMGQLNETSLSVCHLREYLDIPDLSNRGKGVNLPGSAVEIEFDNVSFTYPKSDKNALDQISIKINKGEKIAIVGRNGAGKSTLIKLLCGLYRPSSGKIKVNGYAINEYNTEEYYSLISAVFQDIHLYPASIEQNIALCEEDKIDKKRLEHTIKIAGLQDKISSLSQGKNAILLKSVMENAVDLSGGEQQKLALARALYKDGLILVLDEPTSALDPIAENEIYLKYNELSEGKTSIFISHRLSSTRFCDRIFFIESGKIAETGSHDELMRLNGKYAEIFNIQSHYYKEGTAYEKA